MSVPHLSSMSYSAMLPSVLVNHLSITCLCQTASLPLPGSSEYHRLYSRFYHLKKIYYGLTNLKALTLTSFGNILVLVHVKSELLQLLDSSSSTANTTIDWKHTVDREFPLTFLNKLLVLSPLCLGLLDHFGTSFWELI